VTDYNINKFAFTAGSEFTLDDAAYIGYYNIRDNAAYTGRLYASDSQLLQSSNVIGSDVALSVFFKDRTPTSKLSLPYDYRDIELPPGETLNARIFNDRLYKIYQNFLYTYTKCFIPYNIDPYNPVSVAATRQGAFAWQTNYKSVSFAALPAGIGIDCFNKSSKIIAVAYTRQLNKYALIAAFPGSDTVNSTLYLIDVGDPTIDLQNIPAAQGALSYDYIDVINNKYKNITGIAVCNNFLFVCDQGNNQIYKYNVADLLNQDRLPDFKRVFVEAIGGIGALTDISKFNAPDKVYAFDALQRVFVCDAGNKCIKVYDTNFIHQRTLSYPRNTNYYTQSIAFYEPQQLIFVLVYDASAESYFINIYDTSLQIVETQTVTATGSVQGLRKEKFKELYFSQNDSNVLYMVAEQYIYKVYLSSLQSFSKWLPYVLSNAQLRQQPDAGYIDATIIPSNNNYDIVFAYGCTLSANYTGPVDRVWFVQDRVSLNSVVADRVVSFYTLENFGINDSEFLQAFVINKELFKMTYNIFTLRNLIRGKFAIKFDVANNVVADNYAALSDAEVDVLRVDYKQNMFVHENECMENIDALNRAFEKIFNIQQGLITVVDAVYNNIAFSTTPGTTAVVL
jgi:hypothetical protein